MEIRSVSPRSVSDSYLTEGGTDRLTMPASKARIPREGKQCPAGRTSGFGRSILASSDPGWARKKEETSPALRGGAAATEEGLTAGAGAHVGGGAGGGGKASRQEGGLRR